MAKQALTKESKTEKRNRKAEGATYTPKGLADFVAKNIVKAWHTNRDANAVRILDPAAGDGELIIALADQLRAHEPDLPMQIFGFESNLEAHSKASERISKKLPGIPTQLALGNFLDDVTGDQEIEPLLCPIAQNQGIYDLIIANPPYVRTQVMGSEQAQAIGKQFNLKGRVDLYHAFMLAIAKVTRPETTLGLIVSNRFMTTRSGATVRRSILEKLDVLEIWDLGDTKLFEAAVLPAVILARGKRKCSSSRTPRFTSIYETDLPKSFQAADPLQALEHPGVVETKDKRRFLVTRGELNTSGKANGVWRITNNEREAWLKTMRRNTWKRFGEIGKIRVGIKTCADKVFIRDDWDEKPPSERPELLRPVTTHHVARRFKAEDSAKPKMVLYPHESVAGHRMPADLTKYPRSAAYLETFREVLEGREYVLDAGRQWFEIWVSQEPERWSRPKLVFRDIADPPMFWLDLDGSVVNGDCYWLTPKNEGDSELLWLAASVGNSSFIQRFYDYSFPNKLYSGRRRFMTQYVEQFPLPDPTSTLGKRMIAEAKRIYECAGTDEAETQSTELDKMVWQAFGLSGEEATW